MLCDFPHQIGGAIRRIVIDKDGIIRHIEGGDSAVDPKSAVSVCTDLHKKQVAK